MELVHVGLLRPYTREAHTHSKKQIQALRRSMRELGFITPIMVDDDLTVLAGHGRLKAAKAEGHQKVPCVFASGLSEAEKRAYILADNRLAEDAGWDMDMVAMELQDIENLNFDSTITGFTMPDLETDEKEDDFEEKVTDDTVPITQPGDVWQLGKHRLLCGDATNSADVVRLMNGEQANLFLTDPPYNVNYNGKTKDALTIQNDNMDDQDFRKFLCRAFKTADGVLKPGGVFYIWHAESEGYNFRGACHDVGWNVRQCLIWNKHKFVFGRQDYHWKHEPCLYGWKEGTHVWTGDRKQTTVIDYERPTKSKEHPTMKPVGLFRYCIQNSTYKKDIVLDLFGGSGTTLIAYEKLGRVCQMMEMEPRYCDVIISRWEQLTGLRAVKEGEDEWETATMESGGGDRSETSNKSGEGRAGSV